MLNSVKKLISLTILSVISFYSYADDIDIINTEKLTDTNVLFVMDLSGSMNWKLDEDKDAKGDAKDPSRLQVLRGAFQDIVSDTDFDGINIGLTMFSGDAQGGVGKGRAHGIVYPVSPITATPIDPATGLPSSPIAGYDAQTLLSKTSETPGFVHPGTSPNNSYMPAAGSMDTRQYLSAFSNDTTIWDAGGSTPIVDALFEAAIYFRGESVHFGRHIASDFRSAHPSTYSGELTENTTTVTPACTTANRITVAKGSGDPTESCVTNIVNETRNDMTGGANCVINSGRTATCAEGSTSCALGTNCALQAPTPLTRVCSSSHTTIASCMTANPSYHSCVENTNPGCTTDDEGQTVCNPTTTVICKEDVALYACDDIDNYTCDFPVETCTRCPDDIVNTTIDGDGIYKSPIVDACTKNGVILLSDGFPTSNNSADLVATKIGAGYANGCNSGSASGRCGPELAEFLANEDHADGSTSVPNIDGLQNVVTYTVGLALPPTSPASIYLKDIATSGDGSFVNANDRAELTEAFKQAITSISGKARTFSAPSYSVDTSTLLSHGNDVYVPVFDRYGVVWPGNLKKFQIDSDGVLVDVNGDPATDAQGALLNTARDSWATTDVSNAITGGGAANMLPKPKDRKLYTDAGVVSFPANLKSHKLEDGNSNITKDLLGDASMDNDYRKDLLKYISGENPDKTARFHMGDIIHSKPVQLVRADGSKTIFVGTNEGYLHAIDDADGSEIFAFMPEVLLSNIDKQYSSTISPQHIYGVDGPITLWIDERGSNVENYGNGKLDAGEEAYLFFGLRRGGNYYYAIDITKSDEPKLIWKTQLGTAGTVGDSWSQPVVAMLKQGSDTSEPNPVLVIGGGYSEDTNGDEVSGKGNAVYIVNAVDTDDPNGVPLGGVIWKSPTNTTYAPHGAVANAVPSRVRVLDIDRNGSIDRLYFGDTGGNIWRVDLNASYYDGNTSNDGNISEAKLYKIAELGSSGTDSVDRKFFEEPDVAVFRQAGKYVATIAIGSGDRTKPLDASVDDRFFVLYDKEVFIEPSATTSKITMDSGSGGLKASSAVTLSDLSDPDFRGWHKDLTSSDGEKVLASAVTYNNKVMFTTFGTTSITTSTNGCSTLNTNEARLYIMDLLLGVENINEVFSNDEILDKPQLYFGELKDKNTGNTCDTANGDKNCVRDVKICAGKKCLASGLPAQEAGIAQPETLPRVYWFDNEK